MPRAIGQVTTASVSKVPIEATAYTEQTSNVRWSLQSSSASDAAAGTGVRKVNVTYYSLVAGVMTGPFTEIVTLNGTSAVNLVATNTALLEKLEAAGLGSGKVAAGTISIYNAIGGSGGAGSVFGSIAIGDVTTRWAHHYIPSNRQCEITDIEAIGGDAAAALVEVDALSYATSVELPATGQYGTTTTLPRSVIFEDHAHAIIPGPARVRAQVTPANTDSQQTVASFGYIDRTRAGVI